MKIPGRDDIGHRKYVITLKADEKDNELLGFCFINSKFNDIPAKKNCQVMILKKNYSFLEYDSYADCGEVLKLRKDSIKKLNSSDRKIVGRLNEGDINKIVKAGKECFILSKRDKQFFEIQL